MDVSSMCIGIIVMAVAVIIGYRARGVTHAIFPLRDPVFLFLLMLEALVLILDCTGILPIGGFSMDDDVLTVSDNGSLLMLLMLAADAGYLMGYVMCRPGDTLYLDMPDDSLTITDVGPLVYYRHDGNLYVMPQTVGGIVASFLGARHPLDMPFYDISRQRLCTYTNGIRRPVTLNVVPVSLHETETISIGVFRFGSRKIRDENRNVIAEEPKYLWHPEVTSHRIRFSQTVTDDHLAFWVKEEIYKTSIEEAIEAEERAARLEIQMQSARYDAGADLVSGLVSLSTDANGSQEEILRRIAEERRRRGGDADADVQHP